MSLSVGIVGLPNAGKSTLFNALLGRQVADTAPYPFCTVEPNVGVVQVPDGRLERLAGVLDPEQAIPAAIRFVDIAGLVEGSHRGEGLGNAFLAHIREVDVVLHLVRAFEDPKVARAGSIAPKKDIETANTELVLKDLETVGKVKTSRLKAENLKKYRVLEKVEEGLGEGELVSRMDLAPEELAEIKDLSLLTAKPQLLVVNVGELVIPTVGQRFRSVRSHAPGAIEDSSGVISICAKLEEELVELSPEEREEYLKDLEVSESALDRVIKACYELLGLITFFTVKGGRIIQAWPVKEGSLMIEAAAAVHSDFAEKFIRAEVVTVSDLEKAGSWLVAKEQGLIEVRGRDYVVKDGDVVEFKV